jgi:molybdenum cofactor guanylyltransferase
MSILHNDLTAVILAGGASKRMGTDKALIEYHGKAQLLHLEELLHQVCSTVVISGVERPEIKAQSDYYPDQAPYHQAGPIGGVLTVYLAVQTPLLVIGCDYPNLTIEHLQMLCAARDRDAPATALLHMPGLPEPLLCIYETKTLEALMAEFALGNQSMRSYLQQTNPTCVQVDADVVRNANNPAS